MDKELWRQAVEEALRQQDEAQEKAILARIRRGQRAQEVEEALRLAERAMVMKFVIEKRLADYNLPLDLRERLITAAQRLDAAVQEMAYFFDGRSYSPTPPTEAADVEAAASK